MNSSKLFSSANWIIMLGVVAALIAAQWKHQAIPIVALTIILVFTIAKVRLIVLDFMSLRGTRPNLARALVIWPTFFAAAGLAKALAPAVWH
ncbi:nitric oxide reductase NorF protein [Neorhizobium sp. R1-B]|jgi:nitric oxide reductase NorF protein|uniref:cytochrome C oxidase subunit IV family protein n=1 Tax=Neorhizobium TaxID=1525371 RepID=UPI000CFA3712|nr:MULTISPECIES: cytochrome C oxidase subunit IV family protein [Neorhizobium]TCV74276.1 nitric oxide reductase NorF protein [Neorhizobium sp. S3-V5DH]TDX87462.1 nitric oxide reductase NorF protein [Neorhizobium sp. R1-B]